MTPRTYAARSLQVRSASFGVAAWRKKQKEASRHHRPGTHRILAREASKIVTRHCGPRSSFCVSAAYESHQSNPFVHFPCLFYNGGCMECGDVV
jgi:hypothetical protein